MDADRAAHGKKPLRKDDDDDGRQHSHPRMVLGAYCGRKFDGNLLELMEPGFASQFFPYYIDNSKFPLDWAERSGKCTQGCTNCGYCEAVLEDVLCRYEAP